MNPKLNPFLKSLASIPIAHFYDLPVAQVESALVSDLVPDGISAPVDEQPATQFIEQSAVASKLTKPAPTVNTTGSTSETKWNIDSLLSRPMRAGSYAYTTTSTLNAIIKQFTFPRWYQLNALIPVNMFSSFVYWKGCPKIRVELDGTRFHQGMLICTWRPLAPASIAGREVVNRSRASNLQHAFLDASKNSVVEFDIPFYYHRDFIELNEQISGAELVPPLGTFTIAVWNVLQVSTGGSTTINFTVTIASTRNEFHVPSPSSIAQGGVTSTNHYNMPGWSKVAAVTLPSNVSGDKFDIAASATANVSAMDKPSDTIIPMHMVRAPFPYLGHGSNIEHNDRLCLEPGGVTYHDERHTGSTIDEMGISYLCSKMSFFSTISIADTLASGTVVFYLPMTPIIGPAALSTLGASWLVNIDESTTTYIPTHSYISSMFSYWRGGLKVRLQFVCSAFHAAKFAFTLNYGVWTTQRLVAANVDEASQYTYFFELNADKREFEFVIPYVADTEWKKVPSFWFNDAVTTGSTYSSRVVSGSALGLMSLFLLNPLVHPDNVATSIDCNVFLGAADDFQLNYVASNSMFIPVAQGDCDCAVNAFDMPPGKQFNMTETYGSIRTLLKRFQKVRRESMAVADTFVVGTSWIYPVNNLFGMSSGTAAGSYSHLNFLSVLYLGNRGSVRFKVSTSAYSVATGSSAFNSTCAYTPLPLVSQNNSSFYIQSVVPSGNVATTARELSIDCYFRSSDVQVTAVSGTKTFTQAQAGNFNALDLALDMAPYHQVEVPYVTQNNLRTHTFGVQGTDYTAWRQPSDFVVSGWYNWVDACNAGSLMGRLDTDGTNNAGETITTTVYAAAGDDFRFLNFIGPPMVYFNTFKTVNTVGPVTTYDLPFPAIIRTPI